MADVRWVDLPAEERLRRLIEEFPELPELYSREELEARAQQLHASLLDPRWPDRDDEPAA